MATTINSQSASGIQINLFNTLNNQFKHKYDQNIIPIITNIKKKGYMQWTHVDAQKCYIDVIKWVPTNINLTLVCLVIKKWVVAIVLLINHMQQLSQKIGQIMFFYITYVFLLVV